MHDTDEHYSDERQSHDTRMEYVRKNGQLDIFTDTMCKVSRCNSTKLEAIVQARHHTQHATTYNSAKLEQAPVMVE